MPDRTATLRDNGWWSDLGKRKGSSKDTRAGPPVHDDRVHRHCTSDRPGRLRSTDITERSIGEVNTLEAGLRLAN